MTRRLALSIIVLCMATPALAHVGPHTLGADAFRAGLLHPLTGLDHVAAMIAVGLWASIAGGRNIWIWPAAFVVAMVVGSALGRSGVGLPMVEQMIAASVVVAGLLVATMVRAPLAIGAVLVAGFAFVHGYAHGTEGLDSSWAPYTTGFALSTAMLHAVGVGLGLGFAKWNGRLALRVSGAAIAAAGIALLIVR